MKPPRISEGIALFLCVLIGLIAALGMVGLALNKVDFPWFMIPFVVGIGIMFWLIHLSLPSGDFDQKIMYLWRVKSNETQLIIDARDAKAQARGYYATRVFLGLFVVFGIFLAGFSVIAFIVFLSDVKAELLIFVLSTLIGLGIAYNFAFNLQKTPFMPLSYVFDTAEETLTVNGKTWKGQDQTQLFQFANIKQILAFSAAGKSSIKHHMIRIDILKPHQYFVLNTQTDNLTEAKYYLGFLQTILPEKTRDELGAGKLWVNP